jgi:CelD/BcsL family acetyltransferase involved in cellulose biosynthesis
MSAVRSIAFSDPVSSDPGGDETIGVLTVGDLADPRWAAFVESRPDALAFHHPAWGRLVERTYGYRALVLKAEDENGRLTSGLPVMEISHPLRRKEWVSLPFADYTPPLAPGDQLELFGQEVDRARRVAGISRVEIRSLLEGRGVHQRVQGVRHMLSLTPDRDELFRALRPATRRNVRQAERSGLQVRLSEDSKDLVDDFYRMHVSNRRRLGAPVQPRRFFRILWEEIVESGLGFLLTAVKGNTPVAGAVFLSWNGTLIYKYGASDPRAWGARPNNLVMWEAICRAAQSGVRSLDFGSSRTDQEGLRSFKAGWGASELPLIYSYVTDRSPSAGNSRTLAALSAVIRRSPVWVTRTLGELFYRYAA